MFAVQIVKADYYVSSPDRFLDEHFSKFRGRQLNKVPIIRIFGSTLAGQKSCLHLHGVYPYITVPYDGTEPTDVYMYQLAVNLDRALSSSQTHGPRGGGGDTSVEHVHKVELVSGIPFYGYHQNEQLFLKISFVNPNIIARAVDILQSGVVMNRSFQPHEAHIPFILQVFIDHNLHGMNLIKFQKVKFRRHNASDVSTDSNLPLGSSSLDVTNLSGHIWDPGTLPKHMLMDCDVSKTSNCELEVDAHISDILNSLEVSGTQMNPGIASIWDEERQRRRDKNEASQITLPNSQERPDVFSTTSELSYMKKLMEKLRLIENSLAKDGSKHLETSQDHEKSGIETVNSSILPTDNQSLNSGRGSQTLSQISLNEDDREVLALLMEMAETESNASDELERDSRMSPSLSNDAEIDREDNITMSQLVWDVDSDGEPANKNDDSDNDSGFLRSPGDSVLPQVDGANDPFDDSNGRVVSRQSSYGRKPDKILRHGRSSSSSSLTVIELDDDRVTGDKEGRPSATDSSVKLKKCYVKLERLVVPNETLVSSTRSLNDSERNIQVRDPPCDKKCSDSDSLCHNDQSEMERELLKGTESSDCPRDITIQAANRALPSRDKKRGELTRKLTVDLIDCADMIVNYASLKESQSFLMRTESKISKVYCDEGSVQPNEKGSNVESKCSQLENSPDTNHSSLEKNDGVVSEKDAKDIDCSCDTSKVSYQQNGIVLDSKDDDDVKTVPPKTVLTCETTQLKVECDVTRDCDKVGSEAEQSEKAKASLLALRNYRRNRLCLRLQKEQNLLRGQVKTIPALSLSSESELRPCSPDILFVPSDLHEILVRDVRISLSSEHITPQLLLQLGKEVVLLKRLCTTKNDRRFGSDSAKDKTCNERSLCDQKETAAELETTLTKREIKTKLHKRSLKKFLPPVKVEGLGSKHVLTSDPLTCSELRHKSENVAERPERGQTSSLPVHLRESSWKPSKKLSKRLKSTSTNDSKPRRKLPPILLQKKLLNGKSKLNGKVEFTVVSRVSPEEEEQVEIEPISPSSDDECHVTPSPEPKPDHVRLTCSVPPLWRPSSVDEFPTISKEWLYGTADTQNSESDKETTDIDSQNINYKKFSDISTLLSPEDPYCDDYCSPASLVFGDSDPLMPPKDEGGDTMLPESDDNRDVLFKLSYLSPNSRVMGLDTSPLTCTSPTGDVQLSNDDPIHDYSDSLDVGYPKGRSTAVFNFTGPFSLIGPQVDFSPGDRLAKSDQTFEVDDELNVVSERPCSVVSSFPIMVTPSCVSEIPSNSIVVTTVDAMDVDENLDFFKAEDEESWESVFRLSDHNVKTLTDDVETKECGTGTVTLTGTLPIGNVVEVQMALTQTMDNFEHCSRNLVQNNSFDGIASSQSPPRSSSIALRESTQYSHGNFIRNNSLQLEDNYVYELGSGSSSSSIIPCGQPQQYDDLLLPEICQAPDDHFTGNYAFETASSSSKFCIEQQLKNEPNSTSCREIRLISTSSVPDDTVIGEYCYGSVDPCGQSENPNRNPDTSQDLVTSPDIFSPPKFDETSLPFTPDIQITKIEKTHPSSLSNCLYRNENSYANVTTSNIPTSGSQSLELNSNHTLLGGSLSRCGPSMPVLDELLLETKVEESIKFDFETTVVKTGTSTAIQAQYSDISSPECVSPEPKRNNLTVTCLEDTAIQSFYSYGSCTSSSPNSTTTSLSINVPESTTAVVLSSVSSALPEPQETVKETTSVTLHDTVSPHCDVQKNTSELRSKYVLEYGVQPPSYDEIQSSSSRYGIPNFRHPDVFCSDARDVPERAMQFGDGALVVRLRSNNSTTLPVFQSNLSETGLEHWRQVYLIAKESGYSFTRDVSASDAVTSWPTSEKINIWEPCKLPPSPADVNSWLKARQNKSKDDESEKKDVTDAPKEKKNTEEQPNGSNVAKGSNSNEENVFQLNVSPILPPNVGKVRSTVRKMSHSTPDSRSSRSKLPKRKRDLLIDYSKTSTGTETVSNRSSLSQDPRSFAASIASSGSLNETTVVKRRKISSTQSSSLQTVVLTPVGTKPQTSQLEGPTPKNKYGFKISADSLRDDPTIHHCQYVTIMSMELHVETVEDLRPDPRTNEIRAIFYHVHHDVSEVDTKWNQKVTGIIVCTSSASGGGSSTTSDNSFITRSEILVDAVVTNVQNEFTLIQEFVSVVLKNDPDIFVGYEIQMLSWGFLLERATFLGMNLCSLLSRVPDDVQNNFRPIQNSGDGFYVNIVGRIILSVWQLMIYEVSLYNYVFENVAYHVLHKRIPLFSFRTLTHWFDHGHKRNRWRTLQHYVIRAQGNVQLLEQLNVVGRTSELARLFGIQFTEVHTRGSQFRVESMMLRLCRQAKYIAVSPSVQQRAAMRAPEHVPLIMEPSSRLYTNPVVVLDFQSLYPSIIIAYNYCFSTCLGRVENIADSNPFHFGCTSLKVPPGLIADLKDKVNISPCGVAFVKSEVRKGVLPRMLEEILTTRIMVKLAMKRNKEDKALQRMLDARQLGLKLIANVTYGYTSANFSGRMPCVEIADSVVSKGRETLERAIKLIEETEKWGARVVYGDTDSVFVLLEGRSKEQAFVIGQEIVEAVTATNPKPVKLKLEKVYLPCVLQTKKRYVGYMYESSDQKDPVYDAKGIETVRRDGCPAVAKILEKSLRILFGTLDVSLVKSYAVRQFEKLMTGRANLQDYIFTREYKGRHSYTLETHAPALKIARQKLRIDRRSEPRTQERVPYVIVYGSPGSLLIDLVRHPHDFLQNTSLRLNSKYYIGNVIIPPLDRVFSLVGANVRHWYATMNRTHRISLPHEVGSHELGTISQYFVSTNCPVCDGLSTTRGICEDCSTNPQLSAVVLSDRIREWERRHAHLSKICHNCVGTSDPQLSCITLECPILFRLAHTTRDLSQGPFLRGILKNVSLEW